MSKKLDDISNFAVSKYFDDKENMWIDVESFNDLLAHARALEEMLRNIRNDPMLTLRVQQVWKIGELLE